MKSPNRSAILTSALLVCTVFGTQLRAQIKDRELKYPAVHLIGVGYSFVWHNITGHDQMTQRYDMLSEQMHGFGVNYVWQPLVAGVSGELNMMRYEYQHKEVRDPRLGYSSINWVERSNYSVYRLAFTPSVSFATRGKQVRAVFRMGPEISGNVAGKGTFTRTQTSVLYDTSGNRYTDTSVFIKGVDDWDRNTHVNLAVQIGLLGKIKPQFYYSIFFRLTTAGNYNFIPTRGQTLNIIKSLNVNFYYFLVKQTRQHELNTASIPEKHVMIAKFAKTL